MEDKDGVGGKCTCGENSGGYGWICGGEGRDLRIGRGGGIIETGYYTRAAVSNAESAPRMDGLQRRHWDGAEVRC
jgi:hypothetical protein